MIETDEDEEGGQRTVVNGDGYGRTEIGTRGVCKPVCKLPTSSPRDHQRSSNSKQSAKHAAYKRGALEVPRESLTMVIVSRAALCNRADKIGKTNPPPQARM